MLSPCHETSTTEKREVSPEIIGTCTDRSFDKIGWYNEGIIETSTGWRQQSFGKDAWCKESAAKYISDKQIGWDSNFEILSSNFRKKYQKYESRSQGFNFVFKVDCNIKINRGTKYETKQDRICGVTAPVYNYVTVKKKSDNSLCQFPIKYFESE